MTETAETTTSPAKEKIAVADAPPSICDVNQLQSAFCGAFDLFTTPEPNAPLPPPGRINADGALRNATAMDDPEAPLLQYTSAGATVKTLYDTFQCGAQRDTAADCLGRRATAESPYEWSSFEAVQSEATKIGSFLKSLGITPGQRVGLSGKNAPEYMTAIQGCFWAGVTTVPIYDTFGETECQYIAKQAEVQAIFVSKENLDNMVEWTKDIPSVRKIIVWGYGDEEEVLAPATRERVITFAKCLTRGEDAQPSIASPPKAEDLAIIMYTSGTTGMPKGVMLPHSALVASIASMEKYFEIVGGPVVAKDIFMSYLPLAHVFDFYCECFFLFRGAKIGYYRGDQKTLVDDIGTLKPTIFVGVPRVFERIYKRVTGLVEEGSAIKKFLFQFFYDQKLKALQNGAKHDQASMIGDSFVFGKIKQRLGGRVRFICSGGAPLAQHLEEWLKVTMCCPVVQGYGLTETCAASCVSMPNRVDQLGTVGPPLFSTEAKLDPVPEMGYDGTPENGGEICFRGPSILSGYYQKPDVTAQVLKADGWFHTGDIGKIVEGGCIKIVDRKKQLFKLSQGEYVSPEKVEGICTKSALVGQIWVHGTSTEAALVAVVVPSEGTLEDYGGKEKAMLSDELKKAIVEDLDRVCRSEKLKGYEIPKGVILHADEFTPESGFVTPSLKLKRPTLWNHFGSEIERVYASMRN